MGIITKAATLALGGAALLAWATGTLPGVDGPGTAPRVNANLPTPAELITKARDAADGYDRDRDFGSGWATVPGTGCNTRVYVLARDMTGERRTGKCAIVSGVLRDTYTGQRVPITNAARQVQIDHVVALHDAWQSGAKEWTQARRVAFANDPAELVAVTSAVNNAKSDKGPADWEPAAKAARCTYTRKYVAIKAKWRLTTTAADKAAIARSLVACAAK